MKLTAQLLFQLQFICHIDSKIYLLNWHEIISGTDFEPIGQ